MTDLVMDLRGQTNRDDEMSLKTKSLLEEAADEIECLRSDRALQADKIREMADERDDLLKQLVTANALVEAGSDLYDSLAECDDNELSNFQRRSVQAFAKLRDAYLPTANDVRGILKQTDEQGTEK